MSKFKLSDDDTEWLRNLLRQGSVKWPGRAECLRRARKKFKVRTTKDGKPVFKYFWKCASCKQWERNIKMVEVDHVIEVGSFNGDWNEYLWRLFTTQDNLQCLCVVCHLKKTRAYNSARSRWVRKK